MNQTYRLQAFILKRRNWGEADKIITIFSREIGKKTLMAKNIRRIKSRRAGSLEMFNHTTLLIRKGKGMDLVAETQLDRNFTTFSQNYYKTQIAYQLIELIDKLTREEQQQEELYELVYKAFAYLDESELDLEKMDKIMLRFKLRILEILGFGVPSQVSLETLKAHIEEIIENKLLARESFEV